MLPYRHNGFTSLSRPPTQQTQHHQRTQLHTSWHILENKNLCLRTTLGGLLPRHCHNPFCTTFEYSSSSKHLIFTRVAGIADLTGPLISSYRHGQTLSPSLHHVPTTPAGHFSDITLNVYGFNHPFFLQNKFSVYQLTV